MSDERRYVLILDRRLDFIRLFRADCPVRPEGKTLWEGDGLRRAYDAMKSLNERRRPVLCYYVCMARTPKGTATYRVFKSTHPKVWELVATHLAYRAAMDAAKVLRAAESGRLVSERRARAEERASRKAEKEAMLVRLRRAGVVTKTVPKLTAKDLRYLEWLEARPQIIKDAA